MRYAAPINSAQYWSMALTGLFVAILVNGTDRPICRPNRCHLPTKWILNNHDGLNTNSTHKRLHYDTGCFSAPNGSKYCYLYEQVNIHTSLKPSNKHGKEFSNAVSLINGTINVANIMESYSVMENQ